MRYFISYCYIQLRDPNQVRFGCFATSEPPLACIARWNAAEADKTNHGSRRVYVLLFWKEVPEGAPDLEAEI